MPNSNLPLAKLLGKGGPRMKFWIVQKKSLLSFLERVVRHLRLEENQITSCRQTLENFLNGMDGNTMVGVEYPYVDWLYRDTYSAYYSSKLRPYDRDCIRLSFYEGDVQKGDFLLPEKHPRKQSLQASFLGFLVLRPTLPYIIGRNVLRPKAFQRSSSLYVIVTTVRPTVYGVRFTVQGFPHASQDAEMMVCAETALWCVNEYFANKYPDYRSVPPREIHQILFDTGDERQVPSEGLMAEQMSFLLKKLGFGVRILSLAKGIIVKKILRSICLYVESGIPVVVTLGNEYFSHAMNIIGHTGYTLPNDFRFSAAVMLEKGRYLYDFYEIPTEFVVHDDNLVPYSRVTLNNPAVNYSYDIDWDGCAIQAAIVPLHRDIYMQSDRAEQIVFDYLKQLDQEIQLPSYVVRVFLTSGRSFKNFIADHPDLPPLFKQEVVNIIMPKFVYIAELAMLEDVQNRQARGIIILDATEPYQANFMGTFLKNKYFKNGFYDIRELPLPTFRRFDNLTVF